MGGSYYNKIECTEKSLPNNWGGGKKLGTHIIQSCQAALVATRIYRWATATIFYGQPIHHLFKYWQIHTNELFSYYTSPINQRSE